MARIQHQPLHHQEDPRHRNAGRPRHRQSLPRRLSLRIHLLPFLRRSQQSLQPHMFRRRHRSHRRASSRERHLLPPLPQAQTPHRHPDLLPRPIRILRSRLPPRARNPRSRGNIHDRRPPAPQQSLHTQELRRRPHIPSARVYEALPRQSSRAEARASARRGYDSHILYVAAADCTEKSDAGELRREVHRECSAARLESVSVGEYRYWQGFMSLEEYLGARMWCAGDLLVQ